MVKKWTFFLVVTLINVSFADDPKPIGRIAKVLQKDANPIRVTGGPKGEWSACEKCPVYEGDRFTTGKFQSLIVELDDGSELTIGSESEVRLESWNGRTSENYLRRVIGFTRGVLKTIVNRVYSDKEPFVVKSRQGVMGVRGTEFLTALNQERVRGEENKTALSLYTIKGEVHFAKSESDLANGNLVMARAGYYSFISRGMGTPTTPKKFEMGRMNQLMKKNMPLVKEVSVQKDHKYDIQEARTQSVLTPHHSHGGREGLDLGPEKMTQKKNPAVENRPRPQIAEKAPIKREALHGADRAVVNPMQGVAADAAKSQHYNDMRKDTPDGSGEFHAPGSPAKQNPLQGKAGVTGTAFDQTRARMMNTTGRSGVAVPPQPRPMPGQREKVMRNQLAPPPHLPPPPTSAP